MGSFTCRPGVVADTVFWKKTPTGRQDWPHKWECRSPVAIFGQGEFGNPFDPTFFGNYVRGVGMTQEVALRKLNEDLESLRESLWY